MKILYIDPVVGTPNAEKYPYYNGLASGISKRKDVQVGIYAGIPKDIDVLLEESNFLPDVILFGLGWFGHYRYFKEIKNNKNIPIVVFLFKPQNDLKEKLSFCIKNNVSLILTPVPIVEKIKKETGINAKLFEYGCYTSIFKEKQQKLHDIGFSGAMHASSLYPKGEFINKDIRVKIKSILENKKNINTFWKGSDSFNESRIHNYIDYAKKINTCKIWLATLASHGDVTPRYYEIMASNTLLFCEEPHEDYKEILIDGYNCVTFKSDLSNFESKLDYYLNNETKRNEIIARGIKFSSKNNDWLKKGDKLIKILRGLNEQ